MMTLYHASNVEVREPELVPSNRMLDFGPGFYTTTCREQAVRFAHSVARRRGGKAMLNAYSFDEDLAHGDVNVLRFDAPSEEWLDFVSANRSGMYAGAHYDLIVGPVANDNVYATIGLYMSGLMGKAAAIAELRVHRLYDQYVFCTPTALRRLAYLRTEVL